MSLTRWFHRPDPAEWLSRKEGRNDRVRRRLGWRRAPKLSGPGPDTEEGRRLATLHNADLMTRVSETMIRVEDESRDPERVKVRPTIVGQEEDDGYHDATVPLEEAIRLHRPGWYQQGPVLPDPIVEPEQKEVPPTE